MIDPPRYMPREACDALFRRVLAATRGGGETTLTVNSSWRGSLRWAVNRVVTSGDSRDQMMRITRIIRGAYGESLTNRLDDEGLRLAIQIAERRAGLDSERPDKPPEPPRWNHLRPRLFFDTTYNLVAAPRAEAGKQAAMAAVAAHVNSAGYIEAAAISRAVYNTSGLNLYYSGTNAQYSTTMRVDDETASGWAGVDGNDWSRIDATAITQRALKKCLTSQTIRALEPGRYNTILEPQAVHALFASAIFALDRDSAEHGFSPYTKSPGRSMIGERLLDERLTVETDPTDSDCAYLPFDDRGQPYQPTRWFDNGVLKQLAYDYEYALREFGHTIPRPNPNAYTMSGGKTSVDDMVSATRRGLLVTRFSSVTTLDGQTLLSTGSTRDGVWLIENGRITQAVKNFRFVESPLIAFKDRIIAIGRPQRVLSVFPAVVPPIKVRDFNFTGILDAV